MNKSESFPEIINFFKTEFFSQHELDALKENIFKQYRDPMIRKGAINLINLELLKFELSNPGKFQEYNDQIEFNEKNPNNKVFTVRFAAHALGCETKYLLILLRQKGFKLQSSSKLSENEFQSICDYYLYRDQSLKAVSLKESKLNFRRNFNKNGRKKNSGPSGIFFDISLYGLGKLIYIRRK